MENRKSNLELLRIVAILMIITIHYLLFMMNNDFGNLINFKQSKNYYLVPYLESLFIIGVNLFVLITGYFMVEKRFVNINKIVKLVLNTLFYSLLFFIISLKLNLIDFSMKLFIQTLGSVFFYYEYWFIKVYCGLFCLIPFINIVLNKINKSMYKKLIVILLIIFPLCSSLLSSHSLDSSQGYGIIHFIVMYCIGGYIRLHFNNNKKSLWLFEYIGFSTITFFISLHPFPSIYPIWGYNYIFNIFSSICLFIYFTKLKIQSKLINFISSSVLGIYLIHINQFVAPIIYKGVGAYWDSNMFIPNLIFRVICIFIGCSAIELIKEFIFDKTVYKIIDKIKLFNIKIGNID